MTATPYKYIHPNGAIGLTDHMAGDRYMPDHEKYHPHGKGALARDPDRSV